MPSPNPLRRSSLRSFWRLLNTPRPRRPANRSSASIEGLESRLLLSLSPQITEFMAINTHGLIDRDGDYSDWIEIYNPAPTAVNLDGYYLTDARDNPTRWRIPAVSIDPGGFRVIFASSKDRTDPTGELATNFNLSGSGGYLGLFAPDGQTVLSEFDAYPDQLPDVSYGQIIATQQSSIIAPNSTVLSQVPTSAAEGSAWTQRGYDDSQWVLGATGVGYDQDHTVPTIPGWTVRMIDTNGGSATLINNANDMESVLNGTYPDGAYTIAFNQAKDYSTVNFGQAGNFFPDNALPNGLGAPGGNDYNLAGRDEYVLRATTSVFIPAGAYTIAVGSDEGFMLSIPGVVFTSRTPQDLTNAPYTSANEPASVMIYSSPRTHATSLATFTVPAGGLSTTITLDYYEKTGQDDLELSIAPGAQGSFSTPIFQLLQDGTLGWQLSTPSSTAPPDYTPLLGANGDVSARMQNINPSIYLRLPFGIDDPADFDALELLMRYDDGFIAYINGQEVARRNAPDNAAWNSPATASRDKTQATTTQVIPITLPPGLLQAGQNVLAIQALNASATDLTFLALPELVGLNTSTVDNAYFTVPTPGLVNTTAGTQRVADTHFNHDRGFYDSPFSLTITTATPDAQIRYTLDGSAPGPTTGLIYSGPIWVNSTTTVRAGAFKTGMLASGVDTQTYIFPADVIHQSPTGQAPSSDFPASWSPNTTDYGMDVRLTSTTPMTAYVNGYYFFTASDPVNGLELWKSDGTAAGTTLVKNIAASSLGSAPADFAVLNNKLFFRATNGASGQELWVSDGTSAGTVQLLDINAGSGSSFPDDLTVAGNLVYFAAYSPGSGFQLYKSDGTVAGTGLVRQIANGSSYASNFVAVGTTLYFTATNGTNGYELWKSTGTQAGTAMVKDINPGSGSSYPMGLTAVGNFLYFTANDGANGYELWRSNGTSNGTTMVKNINPGSDSSYPANFVAIGSTVYFTAGEPTSSLELWKTSGTSATTSLVADINPGDNGSDINHLTVFNGALYFSATDGTHGNEPWKYDPAAGTLSMLRDINPNAGDSSPANFLVVASQLYFTATTPNNGTELWVSDGSTAGTSLLRDINPGAASANPANLLASGTALYFSAADASGMGLWKTAGTPASTTLVKRVNFGSSPSASADDLKTLPAFEISIKSSDMWGSTGIFSNPSGSGRAWERPASLELIYPDGTQGFQVNMGVRIRGGYSRSTSNPAHGFRFYFRAAYGDSKLHYPLFGPDGAQEFDNFDLRTSENYSWSFDPQLPSGYSNLQFVQDQVNRDIQIAMGDIGSHGNFYSLFINGMYFGIYNTDERPEASFAASYLGGSKENYDVIKAEPQAGYTILATDGNLVAWQQLWTRLKDYPLDASAAGMSNYYFIQGLNPDGSPILDAKTGLPDGTKNLLDIDDLIDYMLGIYFSGNLDAPLSWFIGNTNPNNFFAFRDRTGAHGGFRFVMHDSEHTFLNVNEDRTGPFSFAGSAASTLSRSNPQIMFQLLEANPEFRLRVADRIHRFMFNGGPLSTSGVLALYNNRVAQIDRAMAAESARWGDSKRSDAPLTRNFDWLNEMNLETNDDPGTPGAGDSYFAQRTAIVFQQLQNDLLYPSASAPEFNQQGGAINPNFQLTISNPNGAGVIYYTLDGSDPRGLALDNSNPPVLSVPLVSPSALVYSGPVTLTRTVTVKARVRLANGTWSALSEQTFTYNMSGLRITEMMYKPPLQPAGSSTLADDYEYVELLNTGNLPLNLAGVSFTKGITFTFPDMLLAPGAYTLIVHNLDAFESRYGMSLPVAGVYTGTLSDKGEQIILADPAGNTLEDFTYSDGWFPITSGQGYSMVVRSAAADPSLLSSSAAWRPSALPLGAPGAADPGLNPGSIVVNEVLPNTTLAPGDWVELRNTTLTPIDISGWFLSDSDNDLQRYQIPAGTIVPAGGYYVFSRNSSFGQSGGVGVNTPFGLSHYGEVVNLSSSDANGNLAGYREHVSFGASDPQLSWGLVAKSTGGTDFVPLQNPTFGSANAAARVGPVVINELMYNPVAGQEEWIELKNLTGAAIPLYDPANPSNPWKLTDGLDYTFPPSSSIPAYGYALVVSINPDTFRSKYNIPASVPVWGPWPGDQALNNGGENVELSRPAAPDPITGLVPYIPVDHVKYNNAAPWPTAPNGTGSTLIRLNPMAYGSDAANWSAGPFGGTPGAPNGQEPPTFDLGPDAVINSGSALVRSAGFGDPNSNTWSASVLWGDGSSGPLSLSGKTFTLNHTYARPGTYALRVTVSDSAGASNTAALTVSVLPSTFNGSTGNDTYTLKLDPSGQFTQFFSALNGNSTPAQPDFSIATALLPALSYSTGGGADTLIVDMTNGNPLPAGGLTFDGGSGSDRTSIIGTRTGALSWTPSSATGLLNIDNIPFSLANLDLPVSTTGFSSLSITTGDSDDALAIDAAAAPQSLAFGGTSGQESLLPLLFSSGMPITLDTGDGTDSLAVSSGHFVLSLAQPSVALTVRNTAALTFNASQKLASLDVRDAASVTLAADGGRSIQTGSLTIGPAALVDLVNNNLIVTYSGTSPEVVLQQYVIDGLAGGHGLLASDRANPNLSQSARALAVFDNHDAHFAQLDGEFLPADFNQALVKYTYLGDANADGKVDPTDYAVVDGKLGLGHSWITGDLNFDGKVDPADYAQIDGNQGAGQGGAGGPLLARAAAPQAKKARARRSPRKDVHAKRSTVNHAAAKRMTRGG